MHTHAIGKGATKVHTGPVVPKQYGSYLRNSGSVNLSICLTRGDLKHCHRTSSRPRSETLPLKR